MAGERSLDLETARSTWEHRLTSAEPRRPNSESESPLSKQTKLFKSFRLAGWVHSWEERALNLENIGDLTCERCELLHPFWQRSFHGNNGCHHSPLMQHITLKYSDLKQELLLLHTGWEDRENISGHLGSFSRIFAIYCLIRMAPSHWHAPGWLIIGLYTVVAHTTLLNRAVDVSRQIFRTPITGHCPTLN